VTLRFKKIGIMGRAKNSGAQKTLHLLIDYLRQLNQTPFIDADTAEHLNHPHLTPIARNDLSQECDLLIVVGGDGSLLQAAHVVVDNHVPILGINRGRLGFLTDIPPNNFDKLKSILEGQYTIEKRFLLTATITYQEKVLGQSNALNEVALLPDSVPHMSEFEIYLNQQFVSSQDSDGLIVATPTGSTAYALSGGGPILHPSLDAFVIVPMFPHTLSVRPIVIEGNQEITIIITPNNSTTPRVSCDSQAFINAPPGSRITIKKKKEHLNLVHPLDYDYYESLRSKLHWGRKLEYTE
jgi:NAD+ kinase